MKLFIWIFAFTVVGALKPPPFLRRDRIPHRIVRRNYRPPDIKPLLRRKILPLTLHPNQKILNPLHSRIHNVKYTPLPNSNSRLLRANQRNNDLVRSTVPVIRNNHPVQNHEVLPIYTNPNIPLSSPKYPVVTQRNSVPKSSSLSYMEQKFLQPSSPRNEIVTNQFAPYKQIVTNSAINPNVVYNPFQPNTQQNNPTDFYANSYKSFLDPFSASQPTKLISPIFPSFSSFNEKTEKPFLGSLKVEQFPEQQKRIATAATYTVPGAWGANQFDNFFNGFGTVKQNYDPENHKRDYSPLSKNYRNDKTHEPHTELEINNDENEPKVERKEHERAPRISQDTPQDIPTKPIYPGEGQWAKPGIKHKPYIRTDPYDTVEESSDKPDGYDTFERGQQHFSAQNQKFHNRLHQFPIKHKLGHFLPSGHQKTDQTDEQQLEEEEEDETFVPSKLYAQVRHSENEEHLPAEEAENGRLKEIIKDSKIQTVYSEEGYEDIGYDHAGHEKLAENDEGFEETEKELKEAREKKVPIEKHKKKSTSYEKGGKLISDEEIEADKASLGIQEDSDSAGSNLSDTPGLNIIDPPDQKKKKKKAKEVGKKKHNNRKDFMSTKQVKTMTTKDKDDGNVEMEITGEVKVVIQPNNSSKSQEFIKKFPTILKLMTPESEVKAKVEEIKPDIGKFNANDIYIEEIIEKKISEVIPTTYTPPEIESVEIPVTTLPTTAISRITETTSSNPSGFEKIDGVFPKIDNVRKKRFTNDFHEVNVDVDFISKIQHESGPSKQDLSFVKYPYYKNFERLGLNENSPLRYAEDMRNIPKKEEGSMAFYEQAESRITCPEIASTVEPIPERILNAEHDATDEDEEDNEENENLNEDDDNENTNEDDDGTEEETQNEVEHPKTPRLSGLGDSIDCLKSRYFGENPLDSPFFKEETVGPVKPIFNFLKGDILQEIKESKNIPSKIDQRIGQSVTNSRVSLQITDNGNIGQLPKSTELPKYKLHDKSKKSQEQAVTTFKPLVVDSGDIGKIRITEKSESSSPIATLMTIQNGTKPTAISLITTPKYKIDFKPKNIYDQIHLLNYLPTEKNNSSDGMSTSHFDTPKADQLVFWSGDLLDSTRTSKNIPVESEDDPSNTEAQMLKRRRRVRIKPKPPYYQMYNVHKYIPTTPYSTPGHYLNSSPTAATTSTNPKSNLVSEVFYKNNIKPNEQMNVFTDILNNIRTSSEDKINVKSNINNQPYNYENQIPTKLKIPPITVSKQQKLPLKDSYGQDSYIHAYQNMEIDSNYYATLTTTVKPVTVTQPISTYKPTTAPVETVYSTKIVKVGNKKRLIVYLPSTPKPSTSILPSNVVSTTQKTELLFDQPIKRNITMVQGMLPPKPQNVIHNFKRDNTIFESNQEDDTAEKLVNKFFFMGLKPPPMQKVHSYSNFFHKLPHRTRKYPKRRYKRNTGRVSYASLPRRRNPEEDSKVTTTTEVDDEYVPHRSKNYYYDEKLAKIVYLNQNKKAEEEDIEDVPSQIFHEEFEEKSTRLKSTTPKQNPIFATATPPPSGQSYIDFVKKLKAASNYHEISDPVPTEASHEITTTIRPASTTPPEFLSILAKVRGDSNFKAIEDPDDNKSGKRTTVPPRQETEEIEEEEEEEPETYHKGNVQNSGGGDILGNSFKIFDINEYIPMIKNYLPKTSVDTSRYKTIQRTSHNTPSNEQTSSQITDISERPSQMTDNSNDSQYMTASPSSAQKTSERPLQIIEDGAKETKPVISTASPHSISAINTLTRKPQVIRTRGRGTTRPTITTTEAQPTTESTQKIKRRRPTRLRTRTTTEQYLAEIEDSSTKTVRRRSNSKENDRKTVNDLLISVREPDENRKPKEIALNNEFQSINNPRQTHEEKLASVFKKYDPHLKHGGNYRKIVSEEDLGNSKTDIVSDSEANQSSSTDKGQVLKDVKVFKNYDANQKHGGNYEEIREEKPSNTKKDRAKDNATNASKFRSDVETISEFDKSKKHGGNYRNEEDGEAVSSVNVPTTSGENQHDKSEENDRLRLNLFNNFHGYSTTRKPQSVSKPKPDEKVPTKTNHYHSTIKPVHRLTDIVPKPEMFFTDPNLPLAVNMLVEFGNLPSEEFEKLSASNENNEGVYNEKSESDGDKKNGDNLNSSKNIDTSVKSTFNDKLFIKNRSEKLDNKPSFSSPNEAGSKKPVIIKDPGKRLYFYAPL